MRSWISGVTTGAGEYAPMPPVFKPVSFSPTRLWSWLVAIGSTFLPSTMTIKLASSPSRNSSITTRLPALPKALPESISRTASSASCNVIATITPLPAAKPSALTTIGAPFSRKYANAGSTLVKFWYSAVGILWRARKSLVNAFEPSNWAAAWVGPKIFNPAARNASTTPITSGASGPTMVNPICLSWANFTKAGISVAEIFTFSTFCSNAVPALPGATKTLSANGDCAAFQAKACSRPPFPMMRMFIL